MESLPGRPKELATTPQDGADATAEAEMIFAALRQNPEHALALDAAADRLASIQQLRAAAGLTQTELADELGVAQETVSKFERQPNPKIATLAEYVHAMGGNLVILAVFDGRATQLALPARPPSSESLLKKVHSAEKEIG